jgi:glycosyltransferase involved in cell wall biosynthesis
MLSLFIPAYNAEKHLAEVISRIPDIAWGAIGSVWIINDGSKDNTGRVAEGLSAVNKKIKPVHFTINSGYGAVVKRGLGLCLGESADLCACLHGDGQYPPEEIPRFMVEMQTSGWDVLQGSRIASNTAFSGGMPLYKYIAGRTLTFFENKVFGLALTDYHSGFMWYSRAALEKIPFDRLSASFDIDIEMIASARACGLRVGELPIPTRYADEVSYLNPVAYGLRVVNVMRRYLQGAYRP